MPVEVTKEKDVPAFKGFPHHQLGVVVDWEELTAGSYPLPVKVLPTQAASVVTNNHTIWVKHRNYFENVGAAKKLSLYVITDEEFKHSVHNVRGIGFAWMDPACKDDGLPSGYSLWSRCEISDNEHLNIVSSQRFAQDCPSNFVFILVSTELFDKVAEI